MYEQLLDYVRERLEEYYTNFKKSPEFNNLLHEIETRELQRNILLRLRMTQ